MKRRAVMPMTAPLSNMARNHAVRANAISAMMEDGLKKLSEMELANVRLGKCLVLSEACLDPDCYLL